MSASISARVLVAMTVFACASSAARSGEPLVDGAFNDWTGVVALAPEAGGTSGLFNVTSVYAESRGTVLFLRFDTGIVRNLQAGLSSDGSPILDIRRTQPSEQSALTIDFRLRWLWADGNTSSTVTWEEADLLVQPTFAASEYELRVDLASVGIQGGDEIAITFGNGSAQEDAAVFTLADPPGGVAQRSYDRPPGTRIRVASINTLQTGLFDNRQDEELARLIDSMDADVYCFQEEYNSSGAQIESLLDSIDPREDGASWNVHKNNDNVVASPYPLVALPSLNSKYAGAVVDLGGGEGVIVFSIHPKCCGYIGSSEDNQRIGEMQALIDALDQVRAGTAGAALVPFAGAPAMVIGDWNLVGSSIPLGMLEDPAGPDLRDAFVGPLRGGSLSTWRGSSLGPGSFMPGRLDLLAVQRDDLAVMNAFTLDTELLDGADLAALGLQSGDSGGSDHLMLVTDVAFPATLCAGDVDGSGGVDVFDFTVLASNFGAGPGVTRSEGDLTGDGFLDIFDFTELVFTFGDVCP